MIIFNNLCFSYTAEDEVAAVASLSQMLALLHSSFCYSFSFWYLFTSNWDKDADIIQSMHFLSGVFGSWAVPFW